MNEKLNWKAIAWGLGLGILVAWIYDRWAHRALDSLFGNVTGGVKASGGPPGEGLYPEAFASSGCKPACGCGG